MKLSFTLQVNGTLEQLWHYYKIENWHYWEEDLLTISLDGSFVTGTKGNMELQGMPPMAFELVSVVENTYFCDKTTIPGIGELYFAHTLTQQENKILIEHSVELKALHENEKTLQLLIQVFTDVPLAVYKLKGLVENA